MAVRQIEYTVYADRLEPSVRQLGGMQGDHKATEVLFEISGSLYKILKEQAESTNGRLIYRFDGYDGAGGVHSSDTKELPAEDGEELLVKLKYPLEEWITRYGGQIKVVLVISLLKDDSTEMELYNYPAVCQLKNRPFGTPAPGENHESISTLAQVTKESAEIAVRAKDEAIAAQIKVEETAEEVNSRIEPLEADIEELKQSSVSKDYVDSHLEGVSDLVSDNQDDIRNLGERTAAVETSVETLKRTYVDTQRFEETSQGFEERITYAESDIINLQEDIVIIKEDYVTKKYVDDAVASSGGGGVSQEYVDNEIETLRHEVATKDNIRNLQGDIDNFKDVVNDKTKNIPTIEEDIETLKDDAETFKENFEVISTSYATKKYVNDAVASSGGGVSSWNDLTDKPFYDEGTKTATLDYANPPVVGIDFNGLFVGKVTDDILTADSIDGAKLSLSFTTDSTVESISEVLNIDTLMVVPFPVGTVYQLTGDNFYCMIVVVTQTGEFDPFGDGGLITVPETGTYLSFAHYSAVTNSISLTYNLIKTLEAKYLEIINKIEDVSVLTEQEFSFTAAEDGTYQAMAGAMPLIVGKTYKVIWDGAEYVYEAINMDGVIMIGDLLAYNPFVIGLVEGSTMIATSNTSATHTISIIEVGGYEMKQEYLPASLYTEIDQRITESIGDIETLLGGI